MRSQKTGFLILFLILALIAVIGRESTQILSQTKNERKIFYQDRAVVLLYHNFAIRENGTAITRERLASHFRLLADKGFNIVSLDQVAGFAEGKNDIPVNAVAITMDDGYASNYEVAFPLLKARSWPATIFLTVSNIGRTDGKYAKSRWLNWNQIREMQKNRLTFGNHTYNGHFYTSDVQGRTRPWLIAILPAENKSLYLKRIGTDIKTAQNILEIELDKPCRHFAAPFGEYDSQAAAEINNTVRYIWSTNRLPVTRGTPLTSLGRVSVGIGGTSADKLFDQIIMTAQKESQ